MRPFRGMALLLALLLVPGLARGQAPASPPVESPEPPPDTVSPPPLTPVEEAPPEAPAEDPEPSSAAPRQASADGARTGRVFLELLGGSALVFLGGYATLTLSADQCDGDSDACLISVFLLTVSSTVLTAPLGVYATGSLLDGQGSLGSAFLGSLVGAGAGFGSGLIIALTSGGIGALLIGIPLGALVGAVIGYEISSGGVRSVAARPEAPPSGLRMIPTVGVTRHGGLVGGLVGSF